MHLQLHIRHILLRGCHRPQCNDGEINLPNEECDRNDLAGKTCESLGYTGGVLKCTPNCTIDESGCTNSSDESTGIQAVRDAVNAAGEITLATPIVITDATVTSVRPAIGKETPGFFIQEGPTGPAIFVNAIDGVTLPEEGDKVSLSVTGVMMDEVRRVTSYTITSDTAGDNSENGWYQDVSNAQDITDISKYESELISVKVTLLSGQANSNTAFKKYQVKTAGYVPSAASNAFVLRVPDQLAQAISATASAQKKLVPGCEVTLSKAIYWAYDISTFPGEGCTEERPCTSKDVQIYTFDTTAHDTGVMTVDCSNADADPMAIDEPSAYDYVQGFDSGLDNIAAGYSTENNFTDANGVTWAIKARTSMVDSTIDYSVDGQGLILKNAATSQITASGFNGGIDIMAFDYRVWNSSVKVSVEYFDAAGNSLGTTTTNDLTATSKTSVVFRANQPNAASFTITASNNNRIILDNIRWTMASHPL